MAKTIRIGAGSAWWGDRIEPAALNAEKGDLDYVCVETMAEATDTIMENGRPTATLKPQLISAEVYLGAEPIVQALQAGAQIVVTGRVADPSIFMAPMMHEFGWDALDHRRLGQGSGIGHLLE